MHFNKFLKVISNPLNFAPLNGCSIICIRLPNERGPNYTGCVLLTQQYILGLYIYILFYSYIFIYIYV